MADNSTYVPENTQSFLDVSMNGGFFSLIEMGFMVILMLVITVTKIVSQCKKSKSTEEKIKILQETFDLKAIEKLGVVMKQDGTAVPSDTLGTVVHAAAQQVAQSIKNVTTPEPAQQPQPTVIIPTPISSVAPATQSVVIDKAVIEEAVQKSVQSLIASQKSAVVQLGTSGKTATQVMVQTEEGTTIPVTLVVSKEKRAESATKATLGKTAEKQTDADEVAIEILSDN